MNTLVESGARRFTFLHDFGDGWEHTIKIGDLVVPSTAGEKVLCIAGENACPPEDVGGPGAYFDFIAAIKDPAHEDHNSMLQWVGGPFDPVAFNIADLNECLAATKA
jgi:hypothetical protein